MIEGPVTSLTKFGAFVQLAEGIEGMVHVSEISAEKRIDHPQDVLKVGQVVRPRCSNSTSKSASLRLSMKQLVPTGLDEYIAEHKVGDVVTGRLMEVSGGAARVELGEGIQATCRMAAASVGEGRANGGSEARYVVAEPMLQARWKGAAVSSGPNPKRRAPDRFAASGSSELDAAAKKIELELAE